MNIYLNVNKLSILISKTEKELFYFTTKTVVHFFLIGGIDIVLFLIGSLTNLLLHFIYYLFSHKNTYFALKNSCFFNV